MIQEYEPGEVYRDDERGIEYEITGVEHSYRVEVRGVGENSEGIVEESVRYPQDSLRRKISQEGLSPVEEEEESSEGSSDTVCDQCGDSFDTERGKRSHVAQVHDE